MKKRTLYKTCDFCGANLDPEERCDCLGAKGLSVSEPFLMSVDLANETGISVAFLFKGDRKGNLVNSFYGKDAEDLYRVLTGRKELKSDFLLLEFDIGFIQEESVLQIFTKEGFLTDIINTIRGKEVYPLYQKMITRKVEQK